MHDPNNVMVVVYVMTVFISRFLNSNLRIKILSGMEVVPPRGLGGMRGLKQWQGCLYIYCHMV